jgi:hypothetical protein
VSYQSFLSNLFCACTISHTTQLNYCTTSFRDALNMPKIIARVDFCFKKAVGFLKRYQNMALPNAVKLADFSVQEQACRAKRMVLHCLWKKATSSNKDDSVTSAPELIDLYKEETMSSVTKDSNSVEEVMVETKSTKVPCIRMSIKSAQLHCATALKE